jgi:hypothetical protein
MKLLATLGLLSLAFATVSPAALPEARSPHPNPSPGRGSEGRGAEERGAEERGAEERGAEEKGAEGRGAEERGVEGRGAENELGRGSENGPAPVAVRGEAPAPAIREIDGPLPADLAFDVRASGEGWAVRARHPKHLLALRRDDRRFAAATEAALVVAPGDSALVWETTDLASLATTRGLLHLDPRQGGEPPALRPVLAEPPVLAGRNQTPLHRCEAIQDGAGGFTVLCGVERMASVENLTGADRRDGAVVVGRAGNKSVVRLDLPASQNAVDARVIGYASGNLGHVIRAEASFLPGEAGPSFTLSSAERRQPVVFIPPRYCCCIL